MTPGEMLLALYDGALKNLSFAQDAFQKKDNAAINTYLQKVQRILLYLQSTLDSQYEISANLNALYTYFLEQTAEANIKKDPACLDEVIKDIGILRNAFAQASKVAG